MKENHYTENELKAKMAEFETRLKPIKKIANYLREVTANPSSFFEYEEEPPIWVKRIADIMITAEITENDYLSLMDNYGNKGALPDWAFAVMKINSNSITHIDQINWKRATNGWRSDVAKAIVECLECDSLKVPVVECMLGQWREENDGAMTVDLEQPFDKFCTHLIANLQSHDRYKLSNIRPQQNGPRKGKKEESPDELPTELQSSEAQALLKRAVEAGLCKPESQGRYKWLKSKQLCAYFGVRMSDYLELSQTHIGGYYTTRWKPFAALFGCTPTQLANSKQDYQKAANDKPSGHEQIDALFDDME